MFKIFSSLFRSATAFPDPYQRIKANQTARVPILIGANQDDGTLFVVGITDLTTFLQETVGSLVDADEVRAVYPGFTDLEIIPLVFRDVVFLWYESRLGHLDRFHMLMTLKSS